MDRPTYPTYTSLSRQALAKPAACRPWLARLPSTEPKWVWHHAASLRHKASSPWVGGLDGALGCMQAEQAIRPEIGSEIWWQPRRVMTRETCQLGRWIMLCLLFSRLPPPRPPRPPPLSRFPPRRVRLCSRSERKSSPRGRPNPRPVPDWRASERGSGLQPEQGCL